jgi:hypothetical protein
VYNFTGTGGLVVPTAATITLEEATLTGDMVLQAADEIFINNVRFATSSEVSGTANQVIINNPVINAGVATPIFNVTASTSSINNLSAANGVDAGRAAIGFNSVSTASFSATGSNVQIFETSASNKSIKLNYRIEHDGMVKSGELNVASNGSVISPSDNYTYTGTFSASTQANANASINAGIISINFTTIGPTGTIVYDATYTV